MALRSDDTFAVCRRRAGKPRSLRSFQVILGWTERTPLILTELCEAASSEGGTICAPPSARRSAPRGALPPLEQSLHDSPLPTPHVVAQSPSWTTSTKKFWRPSWRRG